jgi:hypothetical protein
MNKNIHIIPTDKPSRLGRFIDTNNLVLKTFYELSQSSLNIFITSDEEIKDGDYRMNIQRTYFKKSDKEGLEYYNRRNDVFKKIILTTDQDLIKDGVQAIDDEFLVWFVKNSSCEQVEVEMQNYYASGALQPNLWKPKIIIPQEEPKQDYSGVHLRHCYQGEYEDGCKYKENDCPAKPVEPKQETIEEAAIRLYPDNIIKLGNETSYNAASLKRKDFINGANVQKEQDKQALQTAINLLKQTTEYDVLDSWKEKVKELEKLL